MLSALADRRDPRRGDRRDPARDHDDRRALRAARAHRARARDASRSTRRYGRDPGQGRRRRRRDRNAAPEYEACAAAARAHGVPVKLVFAAPRSAALRSTVDEPTPAARGSAGRRHVDVPNDRRARRQRAEQRGALVAQLAACGLRRARGDRSCALRPMAAGAARRHRRRCRAARRRGARRARARRGRRSSRSSPAIPPTAVAEALAAGATDVARLPVPPAVLAARCRNLSQARSRRDARRRAGAGADQRRAHRRRRRRRGAHPGARRSPRRVLGFDRASLIAHIEGSRPRVRDRRERRRAAARASRSRSPSTPRSPRRSARLRRC